MLINSLLISTKGAIALADRQVWCFRPHTSHYLLALYLSVGIQLSTTRTFPVQVVLNFIVIIVEQLVAVDSPEQV